MEVFTLDRKFLQRDVIDVFHSIIWTEKYYGDSEVELSVPLTGEMLKKLAPGIFLGVSGSREVMMLETMEIEEEKMKFTGISLLSWFNNRFIRVVPDHKVTSWSISGGPPGWVLWAILWNMCHRDSPYLQAGSTAMGIPNPERLIIPGLDLKDYDKSGDNITIPIPYGPVYDAMLNVAKTYRIGMQITLESASDTSYSLGFRSYKGVDRTSDQTANTPVRFSPDMDSLANIKELQSIAALKTLVYAFTTSDLTPLVAGAPGVANLTIAEGQQYTGFDLRALQVYADITNPKVSDTPPGVPLDQPKLLALLNEEANVNLWANSVRAAVDGEIVPDNQYQYGRDYNLGDIIEIQGNSEVISSSRVTEYIRSQDEAGERAYPTVVKLDE